MFLSSAVHLLLSELPKKQVSTPRCGIGVTHCNGVAAL